MKPPLRSLLILALFGACLALPVHADGVETPVTGTFTPAVTGAPTMGEGRFAGTFSLRRLEWKNRHVLAVGTLSGALTDGTGKMVHTVHKTDVALPLALATDAKTLTLPLGPISIEIAGVTIDLGVTTLSLRGKEDFAKLWNHLARLIDGLATETAGLLDSTVNTLIAMLNKLLERPGEERLRTT